MTDLKSENPRTTSLRELLVATDRDPLELVGQLRAAREAESDPADAALARDLAKGELRFLEDRARQASAPPDLRAAVADARAGWLEFEARSLAERDADHGQTLFDLAELRAALRFRGMEAEAARVGEQMERRLVDFSVGAATLQEARERYVALSAEEEDLALPHKILLLRETASLLERLAGRSDRGVLRKLAKRLHRAACDRELSLRVEKVLTRRGATILETVSLTLLVLLFALLVLESFVPPSWAQAFVWFDAGICLFFIVEFAFKFSLSPARSSWFLRNALTDLLPALPAALLFLNIPNIPAQNEVVFVRALRFLRIAYFARYIQALRPLLRLFRLVLFMVRGMDSLVLRFSSLLNHDFVFFEDGKAVRAEVPVEDPRSDVFRAQRREQVLLSDMRMRRSSGVLVERARDLCTRLETAAPVGVHPRQVLSSAREVSVDSVIERLHAARPEEVSFWIVEADVRALDRIVRVINAPVIRSLPFIRKLRTEERAESPEERIVDLGRRVANWLESWRDRILFFGDLHGILTGPQILDRVATAMVNASKRPAVRLLLFGGLFLLVRMLIGSTSGLGKFLESFVATPLLVLGSVCLAVLWLGRWLKRIAGEAAETLKRTSEAHFIGLLELQKRREEETDTGFLAQRVFRWEMKPEEAHWALCHEVQHIRTGSPWTGEVPREGIRNDITRVALLYLHFLDGAILHETDVKTSEQLLANLSLENIRSDHLAYTRRDRKRLRRLSLGEGSIFSGPYVWFRCITESVALETAKRVIDYNRNCLTKAAYETASPGQRARMDAWMAKRGAGEGARDLETGSWAGTRFLTTEFNALDFTAPDAVREEHIQRVFGDEILELLRTDRSRMIREIFGTRPLHKLPRSRRVLNFYALYIRRLSRGRILLLPIFWLLGVLRAVRTGSVQTWSIVREILAPEKAARERESGRAPFSVALRKIHRMKAPGLLEAMHMRVAFDPAYCGAPVVWSESWSHEEDSELERDLDFLAMKEHDREELRLEAERVRRRVDACHFRMRELPELGEPVDELDRRFGERAVTIAYATDRRNLKTLLEAVDWFEKTLPSFEAPETRVRASRVAGCVLWLMRGCRPHPVTSWLAKHMASRRVSRRARRNFIAAYQTDRKGVRRTVDVWLDLPGGTSPTARGLEIARQTYRGHGEVSRELAALRAVQSLSVLDVRNYRKLVFWLGNYAADGEKASIAEALP